MTVTELLAGLLAKLSGLGAAAKAAIGAGLLTASLTTAGATGVLPDPVQHAVADVVNTVSPLNIPDPSTATGLVQKVTAGEDIPGSPTTTSTTIDDDDDDATGTGGTASKPDNHGACVSAIAKDKTAQVDGNHGKAVSAAAKSDCGKDKSAPPTAPTSTTSTTSTTVIGGGTTTTTSATSGLTAKSAKGVSGNGNPGNSGNSGKGNSGNGAGGGPSRSGK